MTAVNQVRVLFFDVYGTCVQQRKPVADELSKAFAALSKVSEHFTWSTAERRNKHALLQQPSFVRPMLITPAKL